MAGLLILLLVMEEVCQNLRASCVAFSSDNSPAVGWVKCLATTILFVAIHLVQALALCLNKSGASPLTRLHICGE